MPSTWRRRRDRAGLAVGTMLLLFAGAGVVQGGDRSGFTAAGTVPSTPAFVAPAHARPRPRLRRHRRRGVPPRSAPPPRDIPASPRQGIRPDASFAPDRVRVRGAGGGRAGRPRGGRRQGCAVPAAGPAHHRLVGRRGGPGGTGGDDRPGRPRRQRAAGRRRALPAGADPGRRQGRRQRPRWRRDVRRARPAAATPRTPCRGGTCSARMSRPGCCWSPAAATSTGRRGTTPTTSWSTRSRSAQRASSPR